ncbi:cell division transporter substrate-binding protein FtsY [Teredinibacter turnerae T7901]|uniref:Cell division transporter substrate-binding protein FtsY n=1 Tax=Teredinibacter turnerae (strain ATCC 39867 / T7901) TaxID=377629 RepID=C5BSC6_TERTT|nr:hypothetical protein [Teredinibacter turnerae]ACR10735.1 cell division transporter substrate-binding protein FtsY [Teredinibacter turnerae T7901]
MMRSSFFVCSLLLSLVTAAQEPEVVEMGATVTGNQEQPKVIYIVPWKQADDDAILYLPLNGKTNAIFGHVERSEHLRELKFIDELHQK